MIPKVIETLCDNITSVYSKNDKNVYYTGKFKPMSFRDKFSSSLGKNIRIENNGKVIPILGMIVEYKCPSCLSNNKILLKRFLLKNTLKCRSCKELDIDKRDNQSKYIKSSFAEFGKISSKQKIDKVDPISNIDLIKISNVEFDNEDQEFKDNYFIKVPTISEFNKIKDKIKINNIDMGDVEYHPHIKVSHSHRYSPKIVDGEGLIHSLIKITYRCDSCGVEFAGRGIKDRSVSHKILCRNCSFSNKTFKIKYTKNINGDKVRYQSIPELDLINYCNINSVLIENGPSVEYTFDGKSRKYVIDFKVRNILIEMKDNHIWYRNEVLSGKWKCKKEAAIKYCRIHNMEYKLVMKGDIKSLKDTLTKYYWFGK